MELTCDPLFDPFDFKNYLKIMSLNTKKTGNYRFQPMRETATYQNTVSFGKRWEERICQLSYNAKQLYRLEPRIIMSSNCIKKNSLWKASTPQTVDLVISNIYNENTGDKQSLKESVINEIGSEERQYTNMKHVFTSVDKKKK